MSATKTATHETELERLRSEKQRLSLDVVNGPNRKAARAELATVVSAIAELESELELAGLAVVEQQRREQVAEQQRQAAEREKLEAELVTLKAQRDAAQQQFTERLAGLVEGLEALYWAQRNLYGKASDLEQISAAIEKRRERSIPWKALDNMSNEIRTAVGGLLNWDGMDYVPVMHRTVAGRMPNAITKETETCAECGSSWPVGAKHNCSTAHCERCHARYAKQTNHRCDPAAIVSAPEPARGASIPLLVPPGPTDSHVIAKLFEGPGGRVYQVGEPVDASEWRNTPSLVKSRYLQPIDRADKPILELASELATEAV